MRDSVKYADANSVHVVGAARSLGRICKWWAVSLGGSKDAGKNRVAARKVSRLVAESATSPKPQHFATTQNAPSLGCESKTSFAESPAAIEFAQKADCNKNAQAKDTC